MSDQPPESDLDLADSLSTLQMDLVMALYSQIMRLYKSEIPGELQRELNFQNSTLTMTILEHQKGNTDVYKYLFAVLDSVGVKLEEYLNSRNQS